MGVKSSLDCTEILRQLVGLGLLHLQDIMENLQYECGADAEGGEKAEYGL